MIVKNIVRAESRKSLVTDKEWSASHGKLANNINLSIAEYNVLCLAYSLTAGAFICSTATPNLYRDHSAWAVKQELPNATAQPNAGYPIWEG